MDIPRSHSIKPAPAFHTLLKILSEMVLRNSMEEMILFVVFFVVGLLIMVLSYLIRYEKKANLISGYDEDTVTDKDGLCNWVGGVMMIPGAAAIITGIVLWLYPAYNLPITIAFAVVTITSVVVVVTGSGKFTGKIK